jgi:hypothetical protein
MLKICRALFIIIVQCYWLPATPAWAADYHLGLDFGSSYNSHANYLDGGSLGVLDQLHFTDDRSFLLMRADPYLSFNLQNGIGGYIQADANWENSDDEGTDEAVEIDLTNAYLSLSKAGVSANLGLQTINFGDGLIMADNVPAAVLDFKHGKGYMQLAWAQALDSSPILAATIGVHPGYFEHAALFGIWFRDQDDAFAKAIPLIYQLLLESRSEGDLYWTGISADLFVGKALFSAMGAYQWGEFKLYNDTTSLSRAVSAFLADLSVEGNLSDWCSLGAFVFVASGDDTPLRDDLNAFVSIMPFNPRAAIFFDPEFMAQDENAEKLSFNGGFFGGVIAPGLTLNLVSASGLALETTLATFYAHQALDDGSQWYGWEVDLGVSYNFARFYTLYAEAARFEHGNYYESLLKEKVDPAMRFSIGLRASF